MELTELLLNRFLYKDNLQNLETKDSSYNAGNVIEAEVPAVASGGAAQDINTSNVTINGQQLTPGTYPVTVLDVSNWGWGQTCVFSSTDLDTVSWTLGVFKSADGVSYNITAGNTGNMGAKTYIYLDLNVSATAYQVTTTPATAVGVGKVLIAVANPDTAAATYNLSEATQIVGDNILANSINASKITTGQLIVGTNVGLGAAKQNFYATPTTPYYLNDIWTSGTDIKVCIVQRLTGAYVAADWAFASNYQNPTGVTTIVGNTVTTGFVNALSVTAGSVAAENITGTYITGKFIRTASSGTRIEMSSNELRIYNGSTLRALGYQNGWSYYNASGTEIGTIYANSADFLIAADLTSTGSMYYGCGPSGSHSMHVGTGASTTRFYTDDIQMWLGDVDNFGFEIQAFGEMRLNNGLFMDFAGSISSGGTASGGTNAGSVSVSHSSTGIYVVTHYMGTSSFTVLITLRNSTATLLVTVSQKSSSTFTVRIGDTAGTLTDAAFDFACFKWN